MRNIIASLFVLVALTGCPGGVEDDLPPDATATVDAGSPLDAAPPDAALPDAAPPDADTTPGHTDYQNGAAHGEGKEDPLVECVGCHGDGLEGGSGPSCYTCHDSSDHTRDRGGVMHRSGSISTCKNCHGPTNSGGLGPACSLCHGG